MGSILSVVDENGSKVFSAEYDAWGKQTVSVNTIGLIRGYGGHEMLDEFNLINMNGRVYDPILGRFLSPDKYVQEGENSQNYNSYSYCLNNPLKYADPSGNVFVLDDFIAITAMGAMMGAMNAAMSDKPIWKGALLGAASAATTYGIGQLFGVAGSFGHELLRAGAHGLSSGVFNALNGDNFWNGLISGAASSGMGSFAQSSNWNPYLLMASTTAAGGAIAWATGGDFLQGALNGLQIGAFNFAEHDGYDGNGGPGYVKRLPDGTLEAIEPLQEVVCKGIKIRPILNVPHEKPLVAVYPEFDLLFGGLTIKSAYKALLSLGRYLFADNKPIQIHHFATNKNKFYTTKMNEIAEKYGLDLDGLWNKEVMPHLGRHPNEYHSFVLENMRSADHMANGSTSKFLYYFEKNIKDPVHDNPNMLRKNFWK
ncbi:MAG: AHH domain-containing protein [Prevotellaceae bacterium]|nr:AHH domain-containing protein [Prevotellaceae bacterium]MDY6131344.1 RHS repeat-associated core domain-containing protein [Prevotella sp.]